MRFFLRLLLATREISYIDIASALPDDSQSKDRMGKDDEIEWKGQKDSIALGRDVA
jgi:hypothetical protein